MSQESLKHVGDALSIGTVVGTIAGYLPAVAAVVTIIWTGIRIYETKTVQNWLKGRREKRNARD